MNEWVKRANFAWFRLMLQDEPSEARRRDLEEKLARAEAEYEASLFGDGAAHA